MIQHLKNHKYLITTIGFIILVLPSLNNLPYGDDNFYIFDSYLQYVDSIFAFWDPTSNFFKSWPLTYSVLTLMFKTFEQNVLPYRLLNLSLHIANSFLIFSFFKQSQKSITKQDLYLIFLLFLIHPISFFTHNWIFQVKTLLSMFFSLIFLNVVERKEPGQKSFEFGAFISFFLAINSKIACVLLPFYLLFKRKNYKTRTTQISIVLVYLLTSGYYGLINLKGINSFLNEKVKSEQSIVEYPKSKKADDTEQAAPKLKSYTDASLKEQLMDSLGTFGKQLSKMDSMIEKTLLSVFTFGKYINSTLGLDTFTILSEANIESLRPSTFFKFALISFLFIFIFVSKGHLLSLGLLFTFFIPVSGLFYVPYMKFSYTAHHWFYMSLPFALAILIINRNRWTKLVLVSTICTQFLITSFNLTTTERIIDFSLNRVINPALYAYKMETLQRQSRIEDTRNLASLLAEAKAEDSPTTTLIKFKMSAKLNDPKYLKPDLKEYLNHTLISDEEVKTSIFLDKFTSSLSEEELALYRAMVLAKLKKDSKINLNELQDIFLSEK